MNKKIINYFILLLPFIDVITAITTRYIKIPISIGIIIKGIFLVFLCIKIFQSKSKYTKLSVGLVIAFSIYTLLYFLLKIELINKKFILQELIYIFKLLFFPISFLGLLCIFDEEKFEKNKMLNMMKYTLITYSLLLILPTIFNISYNTYGQTDSLQGSIGLFYSGNEISNIVVLLLPFIAYFISNKNILISIISFTLSFISIAIIGTKVSLFGSLIILGLLGIYYTYTITKKIILYIHENKENKQTETNKDKLKQIIISISLFIILIILTIFITKNSYSVMNSKQNLNNSKKNEQIQIAQQLEIYKDFPDKQKAKEFLDNLFKHPFGRIFRSFLSSRDIFLINTHHIYINKEIHLKTLFGIGYSNTTKVNDINICKLIEMDILDGIYHFGILGLLIMLSPFILILYFIIKHFRKINIYVIYEFIILGTIFATSFLSGHVLTSPAVSIYISIHCILLLSYLNLINEQQES